MVDILDALTFDDVLLVPAESDLLPSDTETTTRLTRTVNLGIPLIDNFLSVSRQDAKIGNEEFFDPLI